MAQSSILDPRSSILDSRRYLNRLLLALGLALENHISHQSSDGQSQHIALQIVRRVVSPMNAHPRRRPHILVVPQLDDLVKAGDSEYDRHREERDQSQ